ncbi:unnamed protein product [Strongylus vulgaris]|uniref:Uncharacterized protein n=1 Tax=Strongylus vulgaris TaxID=40348 RepID=A0A3P7JTP3_STRVU|nr:unnamed protein product [Strongylus vulgaris]
MQPQIKYATLIPYFVLGLLDTSLLIFLGQSINSTFAGVYGLSIMGAAALGNVLTNVLLLQTQIHFGHLVGKFGLKLPVLSAEQVHNKDFETVRNFAKTLGLVVGCLCGMFPLLFYNNLTQEELERKEKAQRLRRGAPIDDDEMMQMADKMVEEQRKAEEEERLKNSYSYKLGEIAQNVIEFFTESAE